MLLYITIQPSIFNDRNIDSTFYILWKPNVHNRISTKRPDINLTNRSHENVNSYKSSPRLHAKSWIPIQTTRRNVHLCSSSATNRNPTFNSRYSSILKQLCVPFTTILRFSSTAGGIFRWSIRKSPGDYPRGSSNTIVHFRGLPAGWKIARRGSPFPMKVDYSAGDSGADFFVPLLCCWLNYSSRFFEQTLVSSESGLARARIASDRFGSVHAATLHGCLLLLSTRQRTAPRRQGVNAVLIFLRLIPFNFPKADICVCVCVCVYLFRWKTFSFFSFLLFSFFLFIRSFGFVWTDKCTVCSENLCAFSFVFFLFSFFFFFVWAIVYEWPCLFKFRKIVERRCQLKRSWKERKQREL